MLAVYRPARKHIFSRHPINVQKLAGWSGEMWNSGILYTISTPKNTRTKYSTGSPGLAHTCSMPSTTQNSTGASHSVYRVHVDVRVATVTSDTEALHALRS